MSQTPEEGGHTIVRRGALAAQTCPPLPCCEGGDDRPPGDPRPCENSHWRLARRQGDGTGRCGTSDGGAGDKVGAGSTRAKAWSEDAQRERAGPQSLPCPSSTSPAAPDAPVSCHCGCF